MSHFSVLVIVPDLDNADKELMAESLLQPYDENTEVAPYARNCYCIGIKARGASRDAAEKAAGSIQSIQDAYHALPEEERTLEKWDEVIAPYQSERGRVFASHPMKDQPDPDCAECHGTGHYDSSYNPNSKWDWYSLGGRWTGSLTDYDPATDPDNVEICTLCGGSGIRPRGREQFGEAWFKSMNGCNGCQGTGKSLKWPTQWKEYEGDIQPMDYIIARKFIPFAVLTPDGKWHEKGEMGWFEMAVNEKEENDWEQQVLAIYAPYKEGYVGMVYDCHI